MGKNKGKRGARTPLAKWTSVMRKLDNQIEKEKISTKKQLKVEKEEIENFWKNKNNYWQILPSMIRYLYNK